MEPAIERYFHFPDQSVHKNNYLIKIIFILIMIKYNNNVCLNRSTKWSKFTEVYTLIWLDATPTLFDCSWRILRYAEQRAWIAVLRENSTIFISSKQTIRWFLIDTWMIGGSLSRSNDIESMHALSDHQLYLMHFSSYWILWYRMHHQGWIYSLENGGK